MTGEIVLAATPDEIASLEPQARSEMVTHALFESRQWLAVATKGTDPTPIAEFKAWAATVAEMTKQKNLAAEIQADAMEMVRRAERGLGQAIRNGQEAGDIRQSGHSDGGPGNRVADYTSIASPTDFAPKHELSNTHGGIYDMTDGVSDEEFEDALADAREEGNLSRANVIRKIRKEPAAPPASQQLDRIASLASRGYTSDQIGRELGVSEEYIRQLARDNGIAMLADQAMGKTRRTIDRTRIVRETVIALEGVGMSLQLLDDDLSGVDLSEASYWVTSLTESIRALNRLKNQIKEMTQQ